MLGPLGGRRPGGVQCGAVHGASLEAFWRPGAAVGEGVQGQPGGGRPGAAWKGGASARPEGKETHKASRAVVRNISCYSFL